MDRDRMLSMQLALVLSIAIILFFGAGVFAGKIKCGQGVVSNEASSYYDNGVTRIVRGLYAAPGELPFQVGLIWKDNFRCGGVIVDERTILTAAHCVYNNETQSPIPKEDLKMLVGDRDRSEPDGELWLDIKDIIIHEEYKSLKLPRIGDVTLNDIAIIRTEKRMEWKLTSNGYGSINRICMPKQLDQDYSEGQSVWVSGWGKICEVCGLSEVLRIVNVPVVDRKECSRDNPYVGDGQVCTNNKGRKGSWKGDSGGPVFSRSRETKQAELVGLVSYGSEAPEYQLYSVRTRVSHYLDWIILNCPDCRFN